MPAAIESKSPGPPAGSETRRVLPAPSATSPEGAGVAVGFAPGSGGTANVGVGVGASVGVAVGVGVDLGFDFGAAVFTGACGFVGLGVGLGAVDPHLSAKTTAHIFLPSGPL